MEQLTGDKTNVTIRGCKVTCWKHTLRIIFPYGNVFWMDSYTVLTLEKVKKTVNAAVELFETGKKAQNEIIRKILGIRK